MELFENYDRRIDSINKVMSKYGIKDFDDAKKICLDKGIDVFEVVKSIVYLI